MAPYKTNAFESTVISQVGALQKLCCYVFLS